MIVRQGDEVLEVLQRYYCPATFEREEIGFCKKGSKYGARIEPEDAPQILSLYGSEVIEESLAGVENKLRTKDINYKKAEI